MELNGYTIGGGIAIVAILIIVWFITKPSKPSK
jgi:hypothetical protein